MKTITGESFEIRMEDNHSTVFFKGALRLSGVTECLPILDLLKETLVNPTNPVVLDLKELDFLNSSGITMLSRFVIEARDQAGINLYLIASESIVWHARSLKNLSAKMPPGG